MYKHIHERKLIPEAQTPLALQYLKSARKIVSAHVVVPLDHARARVYFDRFIKNPAKCIIENKINN